METPGIIKIEDPKSCTFGLFSLIDLPCNFLTEKHGGA